MQGTLRWQQEKLLARQLPGCESDDKVKESCELDYSKPAKVAEEADAKAKLILTNDITAE